MSTLLQTLCSSYGILNRWDNDKMLTIAWALAILSAICSSILLYKVVQSDFLPWASAKRRLILAGILICAPGMVLAFQFMKPTHAVALSGIVIVLAVVNFVLVFPNQRKFIERGKSFEE